ncbi:WxL domain-containing protein [Vagococcus sp. PNs007]|uniref:WxL domain-containing protein n=1 Tax=Vagococcus proximus TaxID=2991417 RepID=A0ABT5WZN2_9ENTE|nr:WxL domain-containing protein [Vagococcus proximus]MDF0479204.1 WxL domain-containing protein [Vagococcus proximus]
MKKLNLLVAATVLASMTGSLVAGAANVSPTKLDTEGHVKFHAGNGGENGGEGEKPTPPGGETEEKPEIENPENPGGETPETSGPLMINIAPNFDFGDHEIKVGAMSLENESVITSKDANVNYTSYVQVTDVRGGQKGWTLSLDTTALTDGKDSLDGTFIKVNEKRIVGNVEGLEASAPTAIAEQIEFNKTGQTIMTADAQKGGGTWSMVFGKEDIQKTETNSGLTLEIPATDSVKLAEADYTSTLTWNLTGSTSFAEAATPAK